MACQYPSTIPMNQGDQDISGDTYAQAWREMPVRQKIDASLNAANSKVTGLRALRDKMLKIGPVEMQSFRIPGRRSVALEEVRAKLRSPAMELLVFEGPNCAPCGMLPIQRWARGDDPACRVVKEVLAEMAQLGLKKKPSRAPVLIALIDMDWEFNALNEAIIPMAKRFPNILLYMENIRMAVFYQKRSFPTVFTVNICSAQARLLGMPCSHILWDTMDNYTPRLSSQESAELNEILQNELGFPSRVCASLFERLCLVQPEFKRLLPNHGLPTGCETKDKNDYFLTIIGPINAQEIKPSTARDLINRVRSANGG